MLFQPFVTPSLRLSNRIVMAPMTRSRAVDANTPNALMAEYYGQRATAGLVITEGTSPSPNGLGYARIPGLFSEAHVRGWKPVVEAVHAQGGKVFVQLMHTAASAMRRTCRRAPKCSARWPTPALVRCIPIPRECSRTAHRAR